MKVEIPQSLRIEHQGLHDFLARAGKEPGELGEAAQLLGRVLQPHFQKEESFALPALGLLRELARGRIEPEMAEALTHTDWLKKHLPDMLAEHHMILAALERLIKAARAADRGEYVAFAESLVNHARLEEEVLYPAAIVLGEYLKVKLKRAIA